MHPKATIKVTDDSAEYSFQIHLEMKRIDLILKKVFNSNVELIIGMNLVPDLVQIKFYKSLQKVMNDYQNSTKQHSQ